MRLKCIRLVTKFNNFGRSISRGQFIGGAIAGGVMAGALVTAAQTVFETFKTFSEGETISASQLNKNFAQLARLTFAATPASDRLINLTWSISGTDYSSNSISIHEEPLFLQNDIEYSPEDFSLSLNGSGGVTAITAQRSGLYMFEMTDVYLPFGSYSCTVSFNNASASAGSNPCSQPFFQLPNPYASYSGSMSASISSLSSGQVLRLSAGTVLTPKITLSRTIYQSNSSAGSWNATVSYQATFKGTTMALTISRLK